MLFTFACYWITLFEIFPTKTSNYFKIPFKKLTVNKIAWRKALFHEKFEGVAVNLRKSGFQNQWLKSVQMRNFFRSIFGNYSRSEYFCTCSSDNCIYRVFWGLFRTCQRSEMKFHLKICNCELFSQNSISMFCQCPKCISVSILFYR